MGLIERVRRYAAHEAMWSSRTRVVVAVSGGSDSVALLRVLRALQDQGDLHIASVAHLNHRIRPDAERDEAFCRALAERCALPYDAERVDVPALARDRRQSLEVAARIARRGFLERIRARRGAERIATGHTEDDQAETVLLRLIRGAGSRGLSGIAPRRGVWVRPLLCATRRELREHLRSAGETWCEDATNTDLAIPRNRVRHEVLPYLERHLNPSAARAIARVASTLRADDEALERDAIAAAAHIVERRNHGVQLDPRRLLNLPEAVARRVILHAIASVTTTMASARAVDAVLEVAAGGRAAADLSSLRVEPFGENVVLVPGRAPRESSPFRFELPVPGRLAARGWAIDAEYADRPQPQAHGRDVAQIDMTMLAMPLVVRSRRAGDRLRPVGLRGRKKVQDVLVDRKVARQVRDDIPVVTDAEDRIVWVAGHALSEEFRVTARTTSVIILKFRRV